MAFSDAGLSWGNAGGSRGNTEPFPDPFMDYASLAFPQTLDDGLKWCEYLLMANGLYRSAIERVISYFITEIEIGDASRETKDQYKDFLEDTLGLQQALRAVAMDFLTYGNAFVSLIVPMKRYLSCQSCGFEAPLKQVYKNEKFKFRWQDFRFYASCPYCHYSGQWSHIDRRTAEEQEIRLKRWSPHEMELVWDPYSDRCQHVWKIPTHYKQQLQRGHLFQLEQVPWEVLKAVQRGDNLLFDHDVIYHAKEECLAGFVNKGWGISRVLTNFRQAWYVQVLHRFNEAIGLDYIVPFRVLTPEPRPGAAGNGEMTDPLFSVDLSGFSGQVNNMLAKRRRDPASWHVLPFPLKYQMIGGEANALAPHELMESANAELLDAIGVPVEFYKANLTVQAAPAALRLMESTWSPLTYILNKLVTWLVGKISTVLSWEGVTAKLTKPSHTDDLNRQMAKLQLMGARQISQTTGLKSIDLEFEEEQRRMLEEEKFIAEESQTVQEELEGMGMGDQMASGAMDPNAQPPAGGAGQGMLAPPGTPAPGGAGGDPNQQAPVDPVEAALAILPTDTSQPMSPMEIEGIAQTLARTIWAMPESQKDSALIKLKKRNTTVHAVVKSQLDSQRNQAKNQGVAMAQQAAQAQGPGMAGQVMQ